MVTKSRGGFRRDVIQVTALQKGEQRTHAVKKANLRRKKKTVKLLKDFELLARTRRGYMVDDGRWFHLCVCCVGYHVRMCFLFVSA